MAKVTRQAIFDTILHHATVMQAPLLFVVVIGMLIIPMPSGVLDFGLVVNISLTLMILLRTAVVTQPLDFSIFPSLLLVATLLRLSLNISATRLILTNPGPEGAGRIIHAFGTFVINNNPVVGVIIFIILIVIQFVVITAGAGRVAEVAARFTLDAMPGKQMAIDADLNAGIIDELTAQRRRNDVGREADFYGAMDGASKFVRGDAIAAIIMIIINILGGFAVGIGQHHLSALDALSQYTMKTVGEGIITQIPALIMSIATGLIVTRAASEADLGADISSQLFGNWQLLGTVAGIISLFMFIPGLPKVPFMLAASGLGTIAFFQRKKSLLPPPNPAAESPQQGSTTRPLTTEEMMDMLVIDPIEVEIGYGLVSIADVAQGGNLLERVTTLRKQIALDFGFVVPPVRVRDDIQLKSNQYLIKLWDADVARGEILPRHLLAMNPADPQATIMGSIPTTEPAFGLPALWINDAQKLEAEMGGFTVVDPTTVLITHLSEVIKEHAAEILSRQDVQGLIDKVRSTSPALIDDLIPKQLSLSEVHRILQGMLKERISIRDLNRILSAVSDHISATRDIDQLVEYVRQALARTISNQYCNQDGIIDVFTLDPSVEAMLVDHLRPTQFGTQIVLDPSIAQKLLLRLKEQADRAIALGKQPILLCSSQIRPYLRRLIEKYMPNLTVLSHAEIVLGVQIKSSGFVQL